MRKVSDEFKPPFSDLFLQLQSDSRFYFTHNYAKFVWKINGFRDLSSLIYLNSLGHLSAFFRPSFGLILRANTGEKPGQIRIIYKYHQASPRVFPEIEVVITNESKGLNLMFILCYFLS